MNEKQMNNSKPIALITGATGGIGLATSRLLGMAMDLVLTDISEQRLEEARKSLMTDGVAVIATVPGKLQDKSVVQALLDALPEGRSLHVLVHAAGQASVQGDWVSSIYSNVVGTRLLIDAIGSRIAPGGCAVLLSSLAGHAAVPVTELDDVIEDWKAPDLIERIAPHLDAIPEDERSGRCYVLAKRMIIRLCEKLAIDWARNGVRIVSISPGLVDTPMGRAEVAHNPASRRLVDIIPMGKFAKPNDIAAAIQFLASPSASLITGSDLRIDGGLQAALVHSVMQT